MPDGNKLAARLLGHTSHPLLPSDVRETLRQLAQWVLDVERDLYVHSTDRLRIWQRIERDERKPDGTPGSMPVL